MRMVTRRIVAVVGHGDQFVGQPVAGLGAVCVGVGVGDDRRLDGVQVGALVHLGQVVIAVVAVEAVRNAGVAGHLLQQAPVSVGTVGDRADRAAADAIAAGFDDVNGGAALRRVVVGVGLGHRLATRRSVGPRHI